MEYLVFRLYGPMASWGEIAVGEDRHSSSYPSKSAITGLLGAALGIRREQDDLHQQLTEGYQQAVKVLKAGYLLKDYHTAQAPDSAGKYRYRTRRDEIVTGRDRLGTVLSSREYYTDAQAVIALAINGDAFWALDDLQSVLLQPRFHLYLGRKSCPLSAPLNPQIIEADGFYQALENYKLEPLIHSPIEKTLPDWMTDKRWLPKDAESRFYWEGAIEDFAKEGEGFSHRHVQQLLRHDKPLSRKRWQFQPRKEFFWLAENTISKEVV